MDVQLREITRLIRAKAYDEARSRLHEYIEHSPDHGYAWYLLSFAETRVSKQRAAARRAVKFAPDNQQAAARLAKLNHTRARTRVFFALALALMVIAAGVAVLLATRQRTNGAAVVPTLAELPTLTATPADFAAPAAAPTERPAPALQAETAATAETLSAQVEPAALASDQPTTIPPTRRPADSPTQPPPLLPTSLSTQTSGDSLPPAPTATNIVNLPPTATTIAATPLPPTITAIPPTPISSAAPLNAPVNIGAGQMRVIAMTRPGDTLVRELDGSAPPPPAGQHWVLVEILLVCAGEANCAPETAALRLLGDAGGVYPPGAGLVIEPQFGASAFNGGQVWGFAGFLAPTSDTRLYLALTQAGQDYIFALQ